MLNSRSTGSNYKGDEPVNQIIAPLNVETRRRITRRMMKEHQFSEEVANAVLDETLVFLNACQMASISPSHLVDIGWHTFLLYTREYADYCQQAFGHFVHHNPTDREGEVGSSLQYTLDFFTANGISFDAELWGAPKAGCVGHGGPNCGTQINPRTPCDPVLAFAQPLGEIRSDCDNGGYGGGGCCQGQCS